VSGVYLALGSNLGNRAANIAYALRLLAPIVRVEAVSPLYESPFQGAEEAEIRDQPPYYNAACRVVTGLSPGLLLSHAKRVERQLGRRATSRWAPRPIDVDLVLFDDFVGIDAEAVLPHPRLAERAFVLKPLLDLDAELTHPATGERLADILARLGAAELTLVGERGWHESYMPTGV
jgi:2-amino-4-hydroxy-6-hydroxymethyldihydropteridine diphosphokinase